MGHDEKAHPSFPSLAFRREKPPGEKKSGLARAQLVDPVEVDGKMKGTRGPDWFFRREFRAPAGSREISGSRIDRSCAPGVQTLSVAASVYLILSE